MLRPGPGAITDHWIFTFYIFFGHKFNGTYILPVLFLFLWFIVRCKLELLDERPGPGEIIGYVFFQALKTAANIKCYTQPPGGYRYRLCKNTPSGICANQLRIYVCDRRVHWYAWCVSSVPCSRTHHHHGR